jgi:ABC-type glycerol-3-phosphate transport system permease component
VAELTRPMATTIVVPETRARQRVLRKVLTDGFFYVLMTALAVIFLAPLAWMITASLRPEREVLSIPPEFFPREFVWENYQAVWDVIPRFLWNSVKLATISVVGVLLSPRWPLTASPGSTSAAATSPSRSCSRP